MVIRPAIRKAKELERERDGSGAKVGHGWEKSKRSLPNREQYCLVGERLGVPREISEVEYDKYLAGKKNGKR